VVDKEKIIELIERNPTIGKNTSRVDIELINNYNIALFKTPIASTSCTSCILKGLDKLRGYVGYNPLNIKAHRTITQQRLKTCSTCEYRVKGGFNPPIGNPKDTCGKFLNKMRPNPDKTSEGVELCGCVLESKAKLNQRWITKLGGCPANKWEV